MTVLGTQTIIRNIYWSSKHKDSVSLEIDQRVCNKLHAIHLFNKIYRHWVVTVGGCGIPVKACTHPPQLCVTTLPAGSSVERQIPALTDPPPAWNETAIPCECESWWTSTGTSHSSLLQKTYTKQWAAPILPFLTPLHPGCGRSMRAGRSVSALFTHKYTQLLLHGSSSMWTPGKEQGSYHPLAPDSPDNS